jgi:hypothetical protein
MKQIEAEGMKYTYFAKHEGLPEFLGEEHNVNKVGLQEMWDRFLSKHLNEIRLVLVPPFPSRTTRLLYFLQWNNGQDLDALDTKVMNDTYTDEDFSNAVLTRLIKIICVRNRDWTGYGLVMHSADIYIGHGDLEFRKWDLRRAVGEPFRCPVCNLDMHIFVVKIFEE